MEGAPWTHMRGLRCRLAGLLCLLASGATTLVHRAIWEVAKPSPPHAAEFGIALATFMLASVGMLLVIHGARLFAREPAERRDHERSTSFVRSTGLVGRSLDTRQGVARMQALRAIEAARDGKRSASPLRDAL